jgi:arylsulfatase A-like enzyme
MSIILELAAVGIVWLLVSRFVSQPAKGHLTNALKLWLTVRMVWLLLLWPVNDGEGGELPAWDLILRQLELIDATTFWTFAGLGAVVRFSGVLASMYRWLLVLKGQRIEMPFGHILGAFLIGRAIGFFLPSTAGLDAYKLYDASRFSGKTVEVTAGTVLEKVLGVTGIFLTYLVALPFGISIFGDNALLVAAITIPMSLGIIGGLLTVLWFPGIVQWLIESLPLPGKARLESVVLRISHATAAYRNKKPLVLQMLLMSWLVHFTTASMYYFMAIAVGAGHEAVYWPIVFGSSIQIFATVIGPTIGGLGVREAAQLLTIGSIIGPGAAIVSATLGFWVGEVPTLFGFIFWMLRGESYRPAYTRVAGEQVDYDEAARAAIRLESDEDRVRREAAGSGEPLPSFMERAQQSALLGLGAGIWSGILVGILETVVIASGGFGGDAQVLWYGPLAYAALMGGMGLAGGIALAILPMDADEIRGWTPSLAALATVVPLGLFITIFRLRRDVYLEQMPPAPVLLAVLAGFGAIALFLFFAGPKLFRGLSRLTHATTAAVALLGIMVAGAIGAALAVSGDGAGDGPPAIPAELARRPNIILVMADTLRADHLSCYGGEVATPNLCALAKDGSIFNGFAHASWTKPSTATLLTSLLPTSHGVMSKPASLSPDVVMISEVMQEHGYATGGIVSNINLAPSFGFEQGYDEYHYLGPDYLFGADESSSKLIVYQLARRVFFMFNKGLRVEDFYQPAPTVNAVAFDFLERHQESRFFLFLHYMDAHDPYLEHPWNGKGVDRASNQHPDASLAPEMHALYKGEIAYLDREFGKLLARLRELGVYDDTVIALVSDHGEEFMEHGGWWHGTSLYEEQIYVPFLVKWAAGTRVPTRSGQPPLARILDVAPTLIAQAGAEVPDAMQGIDLASRLGERTEVEKLVFSEEDHEGNVMHSLRTENWKLIEAQPDGPRGLPELELFDIGADPGETRNLEAETAWIVDELRAHAEAQLAVAQGNAIEGGQAELSEEEIRNLCALGYMTEGCPE